MMWLWPMMLLLCEFVTLWHVLVVSHSFEIFEFASIHKKGAWKKWSWRLLWRELEKGRLTFTQSL